MSLWFPRKCSFTYVLLTPHIKIVELFTSFSELKYTRYFGNLSQYKISRKAMKKYNKAPIKCIPKHAQMSEKSPKI